MGALLWDALRVAARNSGITRLVLDADPAAEAFYAKLGFLTLRSVPSGSVPGRMLPHMASDI